MSERGKMLRRTALRARASVLAEGRCVGDQFIYGSQKLCRFAALMLDMGRLCVGDIPQRSLPYCILNMK